MKLMTLFEIADATKARIIQGDGARKCCQVSTDTRHIGQGDLFIALSGENFDAHNFLEQALDGGASALIVSKEYYPADKELPVLLVKDTTKALQDLANYNRRQYAIPVIAVTGSNGKTSTKDMVAAVLEKKFKTLKTAANFNNHIGLPLTLLKLDHQFKAVVVEMGMRARGEIDELARIAEPTAAIITIIGETHLELLGTVENIALAKGEILTYIDAGKFAILNGDDSWQRKLAPNCRGEIVFYGFGEKSDISASEINVTAHGTDFRVQTPIGSQQIFLPALGEHNVLNALAAIGVGMKLGLSLAEMSDGLSNLAMTAMRLEVIPANNYTIINDAYNASPASMKLALKTLKDLTTSGKSIAVLGNMFELGDRAIPGHQEVGQVMADLKIDYLCTVGDLAENIALGAMSHGFPIEHIYKCADNIKAIKKIKALIGSGDTLLVKGSRGMKMEEIVQALL